MNWFSFGATSVRDGEVKKPRPQRMTLTDAKQAGQYIHPPKLNGIKIWGWNVLLDGANIATMTADDRDLDEQRKIAERMAFAYNLEFGNDIPRSRTS